MTPLTGGQTRGEPRAAAGSEAPSDIGRSAGHPPHEGTVRLAHSFIAILSTRPAGLPPCPARIRELPDWHPTLLVSADRRAELAFTGAECHPRQPCPPDAELTLVIGDDAEWRAARGPSSMASAVCVRWNPMNASLLLLNSIVGLPPVFVHREPGTVIVASELRLIRAAMRSPAAIDPQAAIELFAVGYPLGHRTLLDGVTLMPAGHALTVTAQGGATLARVWEPPPPRPADWPAHLDHMAGTFRRSVRGLRLSDSVFSLTGGLDTRAILSVLAGESARLPACTMSGAGSLSLDARLARELCRAYGLEHVVLPLDGAFLSDLPAYVLEASRLSGGLASLEQAHEVYFHKQMKAMGGRRLSGNLGNQVGRLGLEAVSMRNASVAVLHDTLRASVPSADSEHWLTTAAARSGCPLYQLLIEREYLFASVGNYGIGHHFMIQQSPYASRSLIEAASSAPWNDAQRGPFARLGARGRDLRHRFLGAPRKRSFQRRLIEASGGPAADYPINWGWRARGGVSVKGLGWGTLALIDAASARPSPPSRLLRNGLRAVRADGIHEIKQPPIWLDTVLRDFVNDTLRARRVRESNLFDFAAVAHTLDEHYGGVRSHYTTLVAALDLALAEQHLIGGSRDGGGPATFRAMPPQPPT